MRSRYSWAIFLLASAAAVWSESAGTTASGDDSAWSLRVGPHLSLPLTQSDMLGLGGGGSIEARYSLASRLQFSAGLGYDLKTIKAETTLSMLTAEAGAGWTVALRPRLSLSATASGGYFQAMLNDPSVAESVAGGATAGGNPFMGARVAAEYLVGSAIAVDLGLQYRQLLGFTSDLTVDAGIICTFKPLKVRIQESVPPGVVPLKGLVLDRIELDTLFPVFYTYYDDHPLGRALLINREAVPLKDLKVTMFVSQYMTDPKSCEAPQRLDPGESGEAVLYGLFTDRILEITEGTKVAARIAVEASAGDRRYRNEFVQTLQLHDRNAISWDDDRKAAGFVTVKDPPVLRLSKTVAGVVREQGTPLDRNLATAAGMYAAMRTHGIRYVVDPNTPYESFSRNQKAVDYLQFPRQTLEFKAGDCDDLSALYAALLESVGVETAFITTPGHIYAAAALGLSAEEFDSLVVNKDDLIVHDGRVWLPLEVTELGGGFVKAWQSGAKQWRDNSAKNQARLIPVHEAWRVYGPVGLPGDLRVDFPDQSTLAAGYRREIGQLVSSQVEPQAARLTEEIRRTQGDPALINRLGVLYARYGMSREAESQFARILEPRAYLPALINMGNLSYLAEDFGKALGYYQRAERLAPQNSRVLLGVARASYELGDFGSARRTFEKIHELDSAFADRFAYLGMRGEEATRAAEASGGKEAVVWEQ